MAGWGTALKPASEPIVVARKPLAGTVAGNVLEHGTGALNIDVCRVGTTKDVPASPLRMKSNGIYGKFGAKTGLEDSLNPNVGRWPSNVVWTHAPECDPEGECVPGCPIPELDRQSGDRKAGGNLTGAEPRSNGFSGPVYGDGKGSRVWESYDDDGGASRFFPSFRFEAKAPGTERPAGEDDTQHPTVKPVDLVRWLVRLVTPPGGIGVDFFAGSGTTGEAAVLEGFDWVLIEKHRPYLPLIGQRLAPYTDPVTLARARGRGVRPKRGRRSPAAPDAGEGLF